jgi:putative membrane protein
MNFLVRLLINAAALYLATRFVDGVSYDGDIRFLLVVALVFGILNSIIRPILKLLTFPFLIVTLGLFIFVLNAFMLWLTSKVSDYFGWGFHVADFWAAFKGALVVTVVSFVLSLIVGGDSKRQAKAVRRT